MESLSAMCFSDGSKTEKAMVFTHKPRMTFLSDGLPSARNFEMTSTLLRERDSSSPNPCCRRIMCRARGIAAAPRAPPAFHEGAKDVVQVAFKMGEIVRVWVVDREQLRIVECWVSPLYVSFVVVYSWCGEQCLTPRG